MLLKISWLLGTVGIEVGFAVVMLPIGYDLLGIIYGRDPQFKIGFWGVIMQIAGAMVMGLSKYAQNWWGKK